MKFTLPSTLRSRCLTAVAVALWEPELKKLPLETHFLSSSVGVDFKCLWLKDRDKVIKIVQELILPDSIKIELSRYVEAVGWEIAYWFRFHKYEWRIEKAPAKFYWTPHGTIDLIKTANLMMSDETLCIVDRYKLACMYCFHDQIFTLWNEIDEDEDIMNAISEVGSIAGRLVQYWYLYMKGTLDVIESLVSDDSFRSPYTYGLLISTLSGHEVATRFFFQRLQEEGRDRILVKAAGNMLKSDICLHSRRYTRTLCFVLNAMEEEQQVETLKTSPEAALCLFLDWPFQEYFVKVYQLIGHLLSERGFFWLVRSILRKRCEWYTDYDYEHVVSSLWKQSPIDHRKYVINNCFKFSGLLSLLFDLHDWKTYHLLIADATLEQRQQLLRCCELYNAYMGLIFGGDWELINGFVTTCLLSRDELLLFKHQVNKRYLWSVRLSRVWRKLYSLLDTLISGEEHREEEYDRLPKRPRLSRSIFI